jgi:DNA-binding NtrC family response regulator
MQSIVVVDDEEPVRNLVVQILQMSGWNPQPFEKAALAWEFMQSHKTDILISDVNMAGMGGLELLRLVKKGAPTVKCIMMSADHDKERSAFELGTDGFLAKPFQARDLVRIVNQMAALISPPV